MKLKLENTPSKALVMAVKGIDPIEFVDFSADDHITVRYNNVLSTGSGAKIVAKDGGMKSWNVYKLMSECKDWAIEEGYFLETRYLQECGEWRCFIHFDKGGVEDTEVELIPTGKTELDVVFEACNWIAAKRGF